jgi:hypothetical protein
VTTALAQSKDALTPVVASPLVATTYAVEGTDNKQHIVYELVITNAGTATATLQKIEVVTPDATHQVLASFEGSALMAHLRFMGREPITTPQIEFNGTRLFLVDFTLDKGVPPPATLWHRFSVVAGGPPGSAKDETTVQSYTIAPIAVSTDITVLGPPLAGKGWVALNGCCEAGGVHRDSSFGVNGQIHFAQRFAIDWMLLGADARLLHGDGKSVKDYVAYGATVIAVADGTVVDTLDELDDQPAGSLPDVKTITLKNVNGNYIVLDLHNGKYAFYAHLQRHSLKVAIGEQVKRGQTLALLGNTGNTSAPHLHFHLMDSVSVLGSSGLPYVFDKFEYAGQLSKEQFHKDGVEGEWSKGLLAKPSARKAQFPLDLSVIDF